MSLWSQPPPPQVIGPTASTLPLPHDPIGTQGSQPPLRQVAAAMMMAAVLASWPADLEPRLQKPNNERTKIAPLTLTYGQQPRPSAFLSTTELNQIVSAWPVDVGPLLSRPNDQQQKIAPLALKYGSQPVPSAFLSPTEMRQIADAWSVAYPSIQNPRASAAVLPQPPVVTFVPYTRQRFDIFALNQEPADVSIVDGFVVAQAGVDQPPRQSALSAASWIVTLQGWQPAAMAPQLPKPSAAWSVPPIISAVPCAPLPKAIWMAWEPSFVALPKPISIATLTLPTGVQPVPQGPLSVSEITQIAATLAQSWDAQTAAKNAGWNLPPLLVSLAHTPLPRLIWTAWEPPFIAPPKPVNVAPLTLAYGAPPPSQPPLSALEITQVVGTWAQCWDAQTSPKNASWNVPPILISLPWTRLPRLIWTAWDSAWNQPHRPVTVSTLTVPTANQPPEVTPVVLTLAARDGGVLLLPARE